MSHQAIVFVHGIGGFSSRRILGKKIHYFRALQPELHDFPQPIYFPTLPSFACIEDRARVLAGFLGSIKAEKIDLIAHSMGGLDCRYLIHYLDPQRQIRSLTTIATPHRGSPLVQRLLDNNNLLSSLLRRIGDPGIYDLTPEACARFNEQTSDRPDVIYRSYAGHRPVAEMPLIFRNWARAMQESDGDNDSQVPVASAIWGEFQGVLRAEHWEQTGWNLSWPSNRIARPFPHLDFYKNLVRQLNNG